MATEFTKEQIAGKRDIEKSSYCDFLAKTLEISGRNFVIFMRNKYFFLKNRSIEAQKHHIFSFQRRFRALRSLWW